MVQQSAYVGGTTPTICVPPPRMGSIHANKMDGSSYRIIHLCTAKFCTMLVILHHVLLSLSCHRTWPCDFCLTFDCLRLRGSMLETYVWCALPQIGHAHYKLPALCMFSNWLQHGMWFDKFWWMECFSNQHVGEILLQYLSHHPEWDVTVNTNKHTNSYSISRMCNATKQYALSFKFNLPIDEIACLKPAFLVCGNGSPQELLHLWMIQAKLHDKLCLCYHFARCEIFC
jgi:hypothetical protein